MPIGALGNLHLGIFIDFQRAVLQRRITFTTGRIDAHSTYFAFISFHTHPSFDLLLQVRQVYPDFSTAGTPAALLRV